MDYRLKQNRKQAFIEWYAWSLKYGDCDPPIWLLNYLFKRYEHNVEQKLWIAWIYGTTYHLPTAWVIWNEFPDFELVGLDRLKQWNNENYKRLRYQTDTKYNKGFLPQQFESYKNWIGNKTQVEKFEELKTFDNVWNSVIKNLYKFGRYSTWFYMQTLNECVGLNLIPKDLKLDDYSGSKSHRNGLCYALGLDEWINKKLTKTEIEHLETESIQIQNTISTNYKLSGNPYKMETALCSFKKIFRKKQGRYLGYYLDRQAEEIAQVQSDGWKGIEWDVFWQARTETLHPDLYSSIKIKPHLYSQFLDTGSFQRSLQ
jgi:hypothetical protein